MLRLELVIGGLGLIKGRLGNVLCLEQPSLPLEIEPGLLQGGGETFETCSLALYPRLVDLYLCDLGVSAGFGRLEPALQVLRIQAHQQRGLYRWIGIFVTAGHGVAFFVGHFDDPGRHLGANFHLRLGLNLARSTHKLHQLAHLRRFKAYGGELALPFELGPDRHPAAGNDHEYHDDHNDYYSGLFHPETFLEIKLCCS